jgi:hypothetical protein
MKKEFKRSLLIGIETHNEPVEEIKTALLSMNVSFFDQDKITVSGE